MSSSPAICYLGDVQHVTHLPESQLKISVRSEREKERVMLAQSPQYAEDSMYLLPSA